MFVFLSFWIIYNFGETIIFRNNLLEITNDFSLDEKYILNFIPEYSKTNEDGLKISEWEIPKQSLVDFINRKNIL